MKIGDREIGRESSPYIIAEIGVNHDGSLERALALVDAAAAAGADAVKTQFFVAEALMSQAALPAIYQREAGETDPIAMLRRLELSADDLAAIARRAHELNLHAIVTVFSVPLVELANQLGFDAFKTASPDITHKPLLEALARTGRPLIISTGASTMEEVVRAQRWLADAEAMFMQCVSAYPTPPEHAALGGVQALATQLRSPVGYSDHTTQVETGAFAVAAGACALEKHLTYDRSAVGPDHAASLDPAQFGAYVRMAHMAHDMIGTIQKRPLPIEEDVRRVSRQSIVSARRIDAGQRVSAEDLLFKRPGTGLAPWQLNDVAGRTAARTIESDTPIVPEDLR